MTIQTLVNLLEQKSGLRLIPRISVKNESILRLHLYDVDAPEEWASFDLKILSTHLEMQFKSCKKLPEEALKAAKEIFQDSHPEYKILKLEAGELKNKCIRQMESWTKSLCREIETGIEKSDWSRNEILEKTEKLNTAVKRLYHLKNMY